MFDLQAKMEMPHYSHFGLWKIEKHILFCHKTSAFIKHRADVQELEHVKGMPLCAYMIILKHEYKKMKQKENRGRIRKMNQNGTNERKKKTSRRQERKM